MFKYDEPLCKISRYTTGIFNCKSNSYKKYREIIPNNTTVKGYCFKCLKSTDMIFHCTTNTGCKPYWRCKECNSSRNFLDYTIINYKEITHSNIWYKDYGRYRSTPVPFTGRWSTSHSHRGLSNKGLIVGSYRKAVDHQVLSYDDNIDEMHFIKFIHRSSIRTYTDSGVGDYDYPHRNRHKRTWKRSKKKKHQWE